MKKHNLQSDQHLKKSINLTAKLQKSLKKLLTSKKCSKKEEEQQNYHHRVQEQKQIILQQIKALRSENKQLLSDNQYLSNQILKYKQQIYGLTKELREMKKYVAFLQGYNQNLKKEMAFWLKKPKKQQVGLTTQSTFHLLSYQIEKLREINDQRENQLHKLENIIEVKHNTQQNHDHSTLLQANNPKNRSKIYINSGKKQNSCASCSYDRKVKNIKLPNKDKSKSHNFQKIKKKLCPCHKSYIQTSDFLY